MAEECKHKWAMYRKNNKDFAFCRVCGKRVSAEEARETLKSGWRHDVFFSIKRKAGRPKNEKKVYKVHLPGEDNLRVIG